MINKIWNESKAGKVWTKCPEIRHWCPQAPRGEDGHLIPAASGPGQSCPVSSLLHHLHPNLQRVACSPAEISS